MLMSIGYLSSARQLFDARRLSDLIIPSRTANIAWSITGMLCYEDGNFLQFLEGEAADVQGLFATIGRDPRHAGLVKIYEQPIETRLFPDWTMALRRRSELSTAQQEIWRDLSRVAAPPGVPSEHRLVVDIFLDTFRRTPGKAPVSSA